MGAAPPGVEPLENGVTVAKILIVDDEEGDRLIAEAILMRAGHECFFAHDGEEALREFALKGIDLVLTDLQMPEVHGFELISVLRDFDTPPALVAVSGTGQFQLRKKCKYYLKIKTNISE